MMESKRSASSAYASLKKKFGGYDLPEFEELDRLLDISSTENVKFLSREIRKKLVERIEYCSKILEDVLQPDQTFSLMHESSVFSESDKEKLIPLFYSFMRMYRRGLRVGFLNTEEEDIKFISSAFSFLREKREALIKLSDVLISSWIEENDKEDEPAYFG